MLRWNDLIEIQDNPTVRLSLLFNLWNRTVEEYQTNSFQIIDRSTYKIHIFDTYERIRYPMFTTSIIRMNPDKNMGSQKNKVLDLIMDDEENYRILKQLSLVFNTYVEDSYRELIIRKHFYHQRVSAIVMSCNISRATYHRMINKAEQSLIKLFCLDESNLTKDENWETLLSNQRKRLTQRN